MGSTKSLKKSFNKYNKKYRFQRTNQNNDNWHTIFFDKKTALFLIKQNSISSNFEFRLQPYNFYFLQSIFWYLKRKLFIFRKKYLKSKKYITDLLILIIGTIISYAILKYILHWL